MLTDGPPYETRSDLRYMIGIGGCGMSGLAGLYYARGLPVAGTDAYDSDTTAALAAQSIRVTTGQPPEALPMGTATVVASAAVRPDHPLVVDARNKGVPVLTYAQALGEAMRDMTGVAVAGTHGKSTTTAMLGVCLTEAGLDPTVIVGATSSHFPDASGRPTGFRLGAERTPSGRFAGVPGLLVAEACEYNRSFHSLTPRIASIGSVEADHLDIYGSVDAVIEAFRGFALLLPPAHPDPARSGTLIIGHDAAHRREVTRGVGCDVQTIGFNPAADWNVRFDPATRRVGLTFRGENVAAFTSPIPGEHNALNACTAFALAESLGADREAVVRGLAAFRGVHRRLEWLGERELPGGGSASVYDDYGHHPTEVDMTLRAIRAHERIESPRRLICVFQPHQHSRTRFFLDEFANAFEQADLVIVPHIYFVRDSEAERQMVSAADLVDRLGRRGVRAMHIDSFGAIVERLEGLVGDGDVLVVMGAGPVWQVARSFMDRTLHAGQPA